MKVVHTYQKYWFRLLQILRKYNFFKRFGVFKVGIAKGNARNPVLSNENRILEQNTIQVSSISPPSTKEEIKQYQ